MAIDERVMLRFSCATVSLPTVAVEDAPALLREIGLAGIEWRVGEHPAAMGSSAERFLTDNRCTLAPTVEAAVRARELCAEAGIAIVGLAPYIAIGDLDALATALDMARAAGAPLVRLQGARPGRSLGYREALAATEAFLAGAVPLAARAGVKLGLEMHQDTVAPSASMAARLVRPFDPRHLGVIYDAGNLIFEGYVRHGLGLEVLGAHLAHVHLKNATIAPPERRPGVWRPRWAPLDDGAIDVPAFLRALRQVGYGGWVSLEDLSTERTPVETLRHNAEVLRATGELVAV